MKRLRYPVIFWVFFFTALSGYAQDVVFTTPNDAVNFAVQNSQVYMLQKQKTLENMKAAKFGFQDFLPSFTFGLSETDNTSLLSADTRSKSFEASINQDIFDGGKKKLAYDMNRLSSLYAYQDYESALRAFSSDIMSQYYQLLMQMQMVSIKEELVGAAKSQLDIIQKEVEIGITLETDYLEYLISYMQIEYDRDQSKRDLQTLERKFKIVIDLPEEAKLTINDRTYDSFTYFYYELYTEFLWAIIRNGSTEIKKQYLALEFTRKQQIYTRRWYIPKVSAQGGITFTGEAYPLTEPKYSFKLNFEFVNAELFPLRLSNGYGFDRERLSNVTNSASVNLNPNPAYGVQRKLADISLLETNIQRVQTEKNLRETVFDLIISHDNSLRSADIAERTIAILEKRVEFSLHQVEQGEKKRIEYLEELITMAQTKIARIEYHTQAAAQERALEILAGFPFGDLQNVCKKQNI
ncbi:hypothetical protein AGMMS50293_29710 [Spirochaetia bacterium]|nr:hypothetical protein AGMMS50293_29710 [Spirochaetia bacterium]